MFKYFSRIFEIQNVSLGTPASRRVQNETFPAYPAVGFVVHSAIKFGAPIWWAPFRPDRISPVPNPRIVLSNSQRFPFPLNPALQVHW